MVDVDSIKDNVLINADCLEAMQSIPDKSIDMILCDPPYGTTHAQWDVVIPSAQMWAQYKRIIKDRGAIVLFSQLPFACDLIAGARRLYRYEIIWHKTMPVGFLNAHKMPLRVHENILIFYKHLPIYHPQKWKSTPYKKSKGTHVTGLYDIHGPRDTESADGSRYPIDVLKFSNDKQAGGGNHDHPTGKPVKLLEWLIKTYTNPGSLVLDNAMGCGSCGIACANTGRRFIGIEKDPGFYYMAKEKINDAYEHHMMD